MPCDPWQSAHTAPGRPSATARAWTLLEYASTGRTTGMRKLCATSPSRWQRAHVSAIEDRFTGEVASELATRAWRSPWHPTHPAGAAFCAPCTLSANVPATSAWQGEQLGRGTSLG